DARVLHARVEPSGGLRSASGDRPNLLHRGALSQVPGFFGSRSVTRAAEELAPGFAAVRAPAHDGPVGEVRDGGEEAVLRARRKLERRDGPPRKERPGEAPRPPLAVRVEAEEAVL